MHKEYTKVVKEKFGKMLMEALPQFRLSRLQWNAAGGRLYHFAPNDCLILFVALIIHDDADEFNLDIGFTREGLCPIRDDEKDLWWVIEDCLAIDQGKARFEQTGTTALTPGEYLPRIDALIADAVKELQQYAVPYFDTLSRQTDKTKTMC